jgi:predicted RecA/RadA family phage recombinase
MAVMKRDGANGAIAYPKNIYTALANGAITAGDVVKVETDTSADPDPDTYGAAGFIVAATAESNSPLAFGVAVTTAADGEEVQVQTSGFNDAVTSAEAIAIGEMVGGSANGDVRQWDTEGATSQPFAVCVNAFSGTTNDGAILIIDKGWFY